MKPEPTRPAAARPVSPPRVEGKTGRVPASARGAAPSPRPGLSRLRAAAFGLVALAALLALAGTGLVLTGIVKLPWAGGPASAASDDFRPYSPDESFQLSFPGHAEWVDEPLTIIRNKDRIDSSIKLFKSYARRDGFEYAVYVPQIKPEETSGGSEELATTAVNGLAGLIIDGQPEKASSIPEGYPAVQIVVPVPKRDTTYVLRGIAIEDRAYVMFVRGQGVTPEHPNVKAFFDSFRHATVPPPETGYRAPEGEAFQPLATIPRFSWAVFSPKGDAVYTNGPTADWFGRAFQPRDELAPDVLVRYEYPSFRRAVAFALAERGTVPHLDVANQRFYLAGSVYRGNNRPGLYRVARYDLAKLEQGPLTKAAANPPTAAFEIESGKRPWGCETALSGDGRYLFVLAGNYSVSTNSNNRQAGEATLYRIDPVTMKSDREMAIPSATGGLAAAPDGRSVYVIANRETSSCAVWDIDPDGWKVRRELKPRAPAAFDFLTVSSSGALFLNGTENRKGSGATWSTVQPVRVFDPTHNPPLDRRLKARPTEQPLVTDGRRLIMAPPDWPMKPLLLWDVEGELKTHRANRLGILDPQRGLNYYSGSQPVLSPDSRSILLANGKAYWLAGSGPPPKVDPAAAWKP